MLKATMNGLIAIALAGAMGGCATAAKLGDDAIREGSFGRIQATPFMDVVNERSCKTALDHAMGFSKQSLAVVNGVQVKQAYHCEAERVVARVSLKNLTATPMQCVADTDLAQSGVRVGPYGVAQYEYAYVQVASHTCFGLG